MEIFNFDLEQQTITFYPKKGRYTEFTDLVRAFLKLFYKKHTIDVYADKTHFYLKLKVKSGYNYKSYTLLLIEKNKISSVTFNSLNDAIRDALDKAKQDEQERLDKERIVLNRLNDIRIKLANIGIVIGPYEDITLGSNLIKIDLSTFKIKLFPNKQPECKIHLNEKSYTSAELTSIQNSLTQLEARISKLDYSTLFNN